jgi:hypothetical protein
MTLLIPAKAAATAAVSAAAVHKESQYNQMIESAEVRDENIVS